MAAPRPVGRVVTEASETVIEVIHGDALNLTPEDFCSAALLAVDPPYSKHVHKSATSCGTMTSRKRTISRDLGFAHLQDPLRVQIAIASACVQRWSVIFSDDRSTHLWREACEAAGSELVRIVPWIRWSQPQLSGDRPPQGYEDVSIVSAPESRVLVAHPEGRKRWNGPGNLTHFYRRCLRAGKDGGGKHPTEKPLGLLLDIVSWFSDPGELVIDLCAGAGTTALACRLLGRSCRAWELDPKWATYAAARAEASLSERDLKLVLEWCDDTEARAKAVKPPKSKHDIRTWERAQRRLADVARVRAAVAA